MSFFRKKKAVDLAQQEKAIDKEMAERKRVTDQARAEEEPALEVGEVRVKNIETRSKTVVSDEVSRERNRMKFKDSTGLVAPSERNTYPTFNVFYLGRIPTSKEHGLEAVEGPVDQLCKLRDKQKLPKVALTFDTEGFLIKEVASSIFSKTKKKKDGIDLFIPLHHITYGVASEGHPQVFACIARMAEDDTGYDDGLPVLMLYAFQCEKLDTAQQITYWQLQAYIEAYEELKRKKILRNRRKQALGPRQNSANKPKPIYGHEPPPPMNEQQAEENGNDPIYAKPDKNKKEQIVDDADYATPKKGFKVKNKDYIKPEPSNGQLSENGENREEANTQRNDTEPPSPTEKNRSGSVTSEESLGSQTRDRAFERRIGEMSDLMAEVDAEMLKKLMISKHTNLAREIYFNKNSPSIKEQGESDDEHDNSMV